MYNIVFHIVADIEALKDAQVCKSAHVCLMYNFWFYIAHIEMLQVMLHINILLLNAYIVESSATLYCSSSMEGSTLSRKSKSELCPISIVVTGFPKCHI